MGVVPARGGALFAALGPELPFVHWANYERTKLNLYLERYGDRDGVGERVLANLLDLLAVTRDASRVPLSSYSLKRVETLTGYRRSLAESVASGRCRATSRRPRPPTGPSAAMIIDEILAYNREDLEATSGGDGAAARPRSWAGVGSRAAGAFALTFATGHRRW